MKSRCTSIVCVRVFSSFSLLSVSCLSALAGDITAVHGTVVTQANQSIPGCSVYLASRRVRTQPAITVTDGTFTIPITNQVSTDIKAKSVYIQVYWGKEVIYSQLFKPEFGIVVNSVLEFPPIVFGQPQLNPADQGAVYYGLLVDSSSDSWTDLNFDIPTGASKLPKKGEHLTANMGMSVREDYISITDAGISWPVITGFVAPQTDVVVTDVKKCPTREGTHFLIKIRTGS